MKEDRATDTTAGLSIGSPAFSVRLRDDVTVEWLEGIGFTLSRNGCKLLGTSYSPLIECLTEKWTTESLIDDLAGSASDPRAIYFVCAKLFSLGLLQVQCTVDGRSLFTLLPAPDWQSWRQKVPASMRGLSPHACLRKEGDHFLLEVPLSRKKCLIRDEECLVRLMEIIRKGVSRAHQDPVFTAFYKALWLMDALEQDEPVPPVWEFHDLMFFHHSSIGFHDDPVGATWRLKDRLPAEPLFRPPAGQSIPLPKPDGEAVRKLSAPFTEVLDGRRSGRIPGKFPVTVEELGALLHVSARIQAVLDGPDRPCPVSLRPSPSGGALHSLEIYLLINQCVGVAHGAWHYDPLRHRLESLATDNSSLDAYLKTNPHALVQDAKPPHIRLVITSRILRDSWKYEKIAYRLVLQDLGCLYQTLNLAASALGMASCILGTVDARRLGTILNLKPLVEPVIGEMTLSSQ